MIFKLSAMKQNKNTFIYGDQVVLVPYEKFHVPKYHKWMQRADLREATASELLTLEEEYAMQQSWREDEDKCTFIILDKQTKQTEKSDELAMIGDVNLYFRNANGKRMAEVGIMIAEDTFRGKGRGFEALTAALYYGVTCLSVNRLEAKVGFNNNESMKLFKKAGFELVNRNEVFAETTYAVDITDEWLNWLGKITNKLKMTDLS